MKKKIIFATSNQGKMKEIREILKDTNCDILNMLHKLTMYGRELYIFIYRGYF